MGTAHSLSTKAGLVDVQKLFAPLPGAEPAKHNTFSQKHMFTVTLYSYFFLEMTVCRSVLSSASI